MRGEQLFREIGSISDAYVEEARGIKQYFQNKKKVQRKHLRALNMAACLVVVCTLGVFAVRGMFDSGRSGSVPEDSGSTAGGTGGGDMWSGSDGGANIPAGGGDAGGSTGTVADGGDTGNTGTADSGSTTLVDSYALKLNKVEDVFAGSIYIPGHYYEALTEEEIAALFPYLVEECEISGTVNYQNDNGENPSVFNIDVHLTTRLGCEAYLQIAPGEPVLDYVFDVEQEISYIQEVPVVASIFEGNRENTYFAEFTLGEAGYYIEMRGDKAEKAALPDLIDKIISSGEVDFSMFTAEPPELRDERLSLEEAYNEADFGSYLPKEIPDNLVFESASRFVNQDFDYLSAFFVHGYEDLSIRVTYLQERDAGRITSVEDTANYDLALYPIPMAESVPEELREIVNDPIFRAEEITQEVIARRARIVEEAGDIDGPRMQFGILYDSGVLVEINSKGPTVEEMLGMIQSISPVTEAAISLAE